MAYGHEFRRRRRWRARGRGRVGWWGREPGRPAHGFPVRGFHTYDLDYGRQAGGPDTDYSGRAGWPTGGPEEPRPRPRGAWEYGGWYGYAYGYEPPERGRSRPGSRGPLPGGRGAAAPSRGGSADAVATPALALTRRAAGALLA